jgi:hypothetical protein
MGGYELCGLEIEKFPNGAVVARARRQNTAVESAPLGIEHELTRKFKKAVWVAFIRPLPFGKRGAICLQMA